MSSKKPSSIGGRALKCQTLNVLPDGVSYLPNKKLRFLHFTTRPNGLTRFGSGSIFEHLGAASPQIQNSFRVYRPSLPFDRRSRRWKPRIPCGPPGPHSSNSPRTWFHCDKYIYRLRGVYLRRRYPYIYLPF